MPPSLCHQRIILDGLVSSLTEVCMISHKDKLRWGGAITFKSVCKMGMNITSMDFWGSRYASFLGNFLSYVHKHLEANMHILKTLGWNRILSSVRKDNLVLYAMSCRIRWKNQTWSSSTILEISLWHLNIVLSFSRTCHHIMSDIGDFSCTTMQDVAVNVSTLNGSLYLFFQLTDVLVSLTQFLTNFDRMSLSRVNANCMITMEVCSNLVTN